MLAERLQENPLAKFTVPVDPWLEFVEGKGREREGALVHVALCGFKLVCRSSFSTCCAPLLHAER